MRTDLKSSAYPVISIGDVPPNIVAGVAVVFALPGCVHVAPSAEV